MTDEVEWRLMSAEALRERAAAGAIVLLPVASTEQHGPHLATGVDDILCGEACRRAARKVLEVMDDVKFVMAGSGDMARYTVELAATLGIAHKVLFTGFLRGLDVERIFQIADLFVMPSVSEPFGIAPLEALAETRPEWVYADLAVLGAGGVSAGLYPTDPPARVGEVLRNALKVDFWDTNELANKMVSVLRRPTLAAALRDAGGREVAKLTWAAAAEGCLAVYDHAIAATPRLTAGANGSRRPR